MLLVFGEVYAELEEDTKSGFLRESVGGALFRQSLAAKSAGARVRFLTRAGRDGYGHRLKNLAAESRLELLLQEDRDYPTSLLLATEARASYRMADAHLAPPPESFYEGGVLLHAGSWIFGMDPGRTTASSVFREGLRRGLTLSLDLRYENWALRADLLEVLRPYLPLGYLKTDEESVTALGIRPGELFQWANTVLLFGESGLRRMTLFEEENLKLPRSKNPDEVYGAFLAGVVAGQEPQEALKEVLRKRTRKKKEAGK